MGILQMWEDLMQKAKDGGIDVIDTYVFWNGHEPSPGNVGFFLVDLHFLSFNFLILHCFTSLISQHFNLLEI